LDNKLAVITGGTTGIGLATAQLFIEEGGNVTVTDRNPETLDQARNILGAGADVIAADAGDLCNSRRERTIDGDHHEHD
jgi:NAD(P)-dependent dehydrogenase (short-subunit alcohol dehydrogenase family)